MKYTTFIHSHRRAGGAGEDIRSASPGHLQRSNLQYDFELWISVSASSASSQAGRQATMSGKAMQRAKAIDWDYLQKVVVSDAGKRELSALRRAYDDVAATIDDKFNIVSSSCSFTSLN